MNKINTILNLLMLFGWTFTQGNTISFTNLSTTYTDTISHQIPKNPNKIDAKGRKTGTWTILYDIDWAVIENEKDAHFYRIITFDKGKPVGKMRDYWRTGQVQMEATLISYDPDVYDGDRFDITEQGYKWIYYFYKKGVIDYKKSIEGSEKLIAKLKEQIGEDHMDYGEALNDLGLMYEGIADYRKAESLIKKGMQIRENVLGEAHLDHLESLHYLSSLYYSMGRLKDALIINNKGLKIMKKNYQDENLEYLNFLYYLARINQKMGKLIEAENLLKELLDITKRKYGEDSGWYRLVNSKIAFLYLNLGRYEESEDIYKKLLKIQKATTGENNLSYKDFLVGLGSLKKTIGKFEESERLYLQSLKITKVLQGENHLNYAIELSNLSGLYKEMGLYEKGELLLKQSLKIKKEKHGENHRSYALSIRNLADIYKEMNRYKEAENLYLKALEIVKNVLGTDYKLSNDYTKLLLDIAELYRVTDRLEESELLYKEAISLNISRIKHYFPNWSEQEKKKYWESIQGSFESFHSLVLESYKTNPSITVQAYNNQLFTKSLLLNATTKMKKAILASHDSVLIEDFHIWASKKNQLIKLYQLNVKQKESKKSSIIKLENEINELEKRLSVNSTAFVKGTDTVSYSYKDIQQKLKDGEAAIEIVRFRRKYNNWTDSVYYGAYIITANSKYPELVLLRNGNDLEKNHFHQYYEDLKSSKTQISSYEAFWQPIAQKLKGIKKVYFSSDGVYNQINLNTLFNRETGDYLLDEINIHLVTSTKEIVTWEKDKQKANKKAVLIGRPTYLMNTNSYAQQHKNENFEISNHAYSRNSEWLNDGTFLDLPGTEKEIEEIQSILNKEDWKCELFIGDKAFEGQLKKVENPKVLHIATHGFFIKPQEKTNTNKLTTKTPLLTESDPMLRSGLVFAGVTNYYNTEEKPNTDDGILTAYEAATLDLDKTELVVLSACETGKGEISNGEGVYGLQRGFQVAGAKSIIMSLWQVGDNTTQEFMSSFYQEWMNSRNKREAFRTAQKKLKVNYPNPEVWGAFVIIGDDSTDSDINTNVKYLFALLGAMVISILIFIIKKKRFRQ